MKPTVIEGLLSIQTYCLEKNKSIESIYCNEVNKLHWSPVPDDTQTSIVHGLRIWKDELLFELAMDFAVSGSVSSTGPVCVFP